MFIDSCLMHNWNICHQTLHLPSIFLDKMLTAVVECGDYEFKGLLKSGALKIQKSGKMSFHL